MLYVLLLQAGALILDPVPRFVYQPYPARLFCSGRDTGLDLVDVTGRMRHGSRAIDVADAASDTLRELLEIANMPPALVPVDDFGGASMAPCVFVYRPEPGRAYWPPEVR